MLLRLGAATILLGIACGITMAGEAAIAACIQTGAVTTGVGSNLDAANRLAMLTCIASGAPKGCCELITDTQFFSCIAFATNPEGLGAAESKDLAETVAIVNCGGNCELKASICKE